MMLGAARSTRPKKSGELGKPFSAGDDTTEKSLTNSLPQREPSSRLASKRLKGHRMDHWALWLGLGLAGMLSVLGLAISVSHMVW
jgi:hypothetical protein